jgi:hypothetical protein
VDISVGKFRVNPSGRRARMVRMCALEPATRRSTLLAAAWRTRRLFEVRSHLDQGSRQGLDFAVVETVEEAIAHALEMSGPGRLELRHA